MANTAQNQTEKWASSYASAQRFAGWLDNEYSPVERQCLADAAYEAAVASIPDAYMNPHVRTAAREAVQVALGLKQLPEQKGAQ
ncbi:MAG: hypothetical protein JWN82_8 [Candidatus Saccharibacteria bacterium]|nr:hypothetical protein [Candidatus Saccharibacteria bacterium]